jgi:hypothetical protein
MEDACLSKSDRISGNKCQTVFSGDGVIENPHHYAVKQESVLPLDKKVTCPFCLGLIPFNRYLVSTKKGISHSDGKCPLCNSGMLLKTLMKMTKITVKEYAEWVFEYSGFWKKVSFDTWKNQLHLMGWTQEFWNRYTQLKEERARDRAESSYESYVERKAMEEQEEWTRSQQEEAKNA